MIDLRGFETLSKKQNNLLKNSQKEYHNALYEIFQTIDEFI